MPVKNRKNFSEAYFRKRVGTDSKFQPKQGSQNKTQNAINSLNKIILLGIMMVNLQTNGVACLARTQIHKYN